MLNLEAGGPCDEQKRTYTFEFSSAIGYDSINGVLFARRMEARCERRRGRAERELPAAGPLISGAKVVAFHGPPPRSTLAEGGTSTRGQ